MNLRNILLLLAILAVSYGAYDRYGRPAPPPPPEPKDYVWLIDMDSITGVDLRLPRENLSQKFVKIPDGDKFPWFFDDAKHSPVDSVRWSSGVPLLLSGPSADRKVVDDATPEELASFGLAQPRVEIVLTLADEEKPMTIKVGDNTPDGKRTYVQAPSTNTVAAVDVSWSDLMIGLVHNPPHPVPATPTPTPRR